MADQETRVGIIRMMASVLAERIGIAEAGGKTYGGKRDVNAALGYKKILSIDDFRLRYERDDLAARIVDAKPEATWGGGGEVIEDPNPDKLTEFEKQWQELDRRLHVWSMFQRADKLAGIGRYGVLVIGAPGNMESPLGSRVSFDEIGPLWPIAEDEARIDDTEWDKTPGLHFGSPLFYRINRKAVGELGDIEKKVHWTRVIHVADGLLDDNFFGQPRMKRSWNNLDNLLKVLGGGSEAFWIRANPGTQFDVNPEVKIKPGQKEAMEENFEDFINNMTRYIKTRGVKITQLAADVANFNPQVNAIIGVISGGTGIPQRILIGSEMGELASTQDRSNWADRIRDRRIQYAEPFVVRQFVDLMIKIGVLPTPKQYHVSWPEVANLTDMERALKAKAWAEVNQIMGMDVTTANEIREHCYGLAKRDELVGSEQNKREEPKDPAAQPTAERADRAARMSRARSEALAPAS